MPLRNQTITDISAGAEARLIREYTIPAGMTVASAELIIRSSRTSLDPSTLILKKVITAVNDSNKGVISTDGASGTCSLRFNLKPTETLQLKSTAKFYWIWLVLNSGEPTCPEDGTILTVEGGRVIP